MQKRKIKKIALLTSGGDSPGMNAAIRSVVRIALYKKLTVIGVMRGFNGLICADFKPMDHRSVSNIIGLGGTVLKTSRSEEFPKLSGQKKAVDAIKSNNIDAVVAIGGDGTYHGLLALKRNWQIPCMGLPGTIDNDLNGTEATIGSDTAVNTALDAIDKIRDTVSSLERIFVVEVMGKEFGYIATQVALAGGAEQVLLPGRAINIQNICREIKHGYQLGKTSWIVIVAEGAGKAEKIGKMITANTNLETRVTVLGHIQRGGVPTASDRVLATKLGAYAVELLIKGIYGKAVGFKKDEVCYVDLEYACKKKRLNAAPYLSLIKILT
ncbi:MAG: 6-phosphofructokinase [Candidatus Omnitrophota bacterium]